MPATTFKKWSLFLGLLSLSSAASSDPAAGCFDPATSPFDPSEWSYCQQIPHDTHEMYMYYTPLEDTVLIGFHALRDTDGWTALAMNGNGGMKGATFIVVRQDDDGSWIAEDRHAMDYVMPTLDEQQDVRLLFAEQEDGQTAWGVAIPKNSCDLDGNQYEIVDRRTTMLWAVGTGHNFDYHSERGAFQANLLQAPHVPASTDGLMSMELRMPNVTMVMGEGGEDPSNPYICSYFDLDEILSSAGLDGDDTVHVTRFSPVLNPQSKEFVHHMILYACSFNDEENIEIEHLTVVPECTAMPYSCSEVRWPWAVGSGDTEFPEGVGLPVGGELNRFLILQMHYYNPKLDEGILDSSGVEMFYTTDLKEQEVGVMQLIGAVASWQHSPLPAGKERVSLSLATPSECTHNVWKEPLNILGIAHHMHTYGIYQEVNVVRNGVNMGNLRPEAHYDFMHQAAGEPIPTLSQLLPGDQVTQTCIYDTTNAPEDVEFGDYTQNEMCYTAIYYYPLQPSGNVFGTLPVSVRFDSSTCSEPATSEEFQAFDLSLCAQSMYENVPAFFRFEDEVEMPFDLLTVCNGGDMFQDLLTEMPYLCPECSATATCTSEQIAAQASGVCDYICNEVGLSLYPNLTSTTAAGFGNFGCDPSYFPAVPSIPEAPECQVRGSSSIETIEVSAIVLKEISSAESSEGDGGKTYTEETEANVDSTEEVIEGNDKGNNSSSEAGPDNAEGDTSTEEVSGTITGSRSDESAGWMVGSCGNFMLGVAAVALAALFA